MTESGALVHSRRKIRRGNIRGPTRRGQGSTCRYRQEVHANLDTMEQSDRQLRLGAHPTYDTISGAAVSVVGGGWWVVVVIPCSRWVSPPPPWRLLIFNKPSRLDAPVLCSPRSNICWYPCCRCNRRRRRRRRLGPHLFFLLFIPIRLCQLTLIWVIALSKPRSTTHTREREREEKGKDRELPPPPRLHSVVHACVACKGPDRHTDIQIIFTPWRRIV